MPSPGRVLMQDLATFAAVPLEQVAQSNASHWRRGFGTFDVICPHQRVSTFTDAPRTTKAATALLFTAALSAQLAVSVTAGVVAGYCVGLMLAFGRREQAREMVAQQFYPMCVVAYVLHIAVIGCATVGASVLLDKCFA